MKTKKPKTAIAITMGDAAGIGPEIIVKLLHRTEEQGLAKVLFDHDGCNLPLVNAKTAPKVVADMVPRMRKGGIEDVGPGGETDGSLLVVLQFLEDAGPQTFIHIAPKVLGNGFRHMESNKRGICRMYPHLGPS